MIEAMAHTAEIILLELGVPESENALIKNSFI